MKEKTFEEILEDYMTYESMNETQKIFVKNMMQQVREATKAECEQYIRDNPEIALDFTRGREIKIDIPTDRILTRCENCDMVGGGSGFCVDNDIDMDIRH